MAPVTNNQIVRTPGYLLTGGTGVSAGCWPATKRYSRVQGEALAAAAMHKQVRPTTTVDVPTGTPPSVCWRRP